MAASKTGDKRSMEKEKDLTSAEDSSDSESEPEPAKIFHRRISTNKDIRTSVCCFENCITYVARCIRLLSVSFSLSLTCHCCLTE